MPDSTEAGYLQPSDPPTAPLEGAALEDFFHDLIVGLTGVDDQLVRPAWQDESINIPVAGAVWVAFHFVDIKSDTFPFVGQVVEGDEVQQSQLQTNEEFNVHCSIYGTGAGSGARAIAKLLRDNIMVPQNQESLGPQGMALIGAPSAPQPVPVLVKTKWLYRVDLAIPIRRLIVRDYDVKTIESADLSLIAQTSPTTEIEASLVVEQDT